MEASSPLAAMQPTAAPSWCFAAHGPFGSGNIFGGSRPSIRNQLQRARPDYFNVKSIRGSSPSASLAADLSQNFSIDNDFSPRFPTPRRALFTSNMTGRETITTPPLPPSSSPWPVPSEVMDISPVPQKEPFGASIEIISPTPVQSPDVDMMEESPLQMTRPSSTMLDIPRSVTDSRKRLGLRRPSLTRTKGHSTSSLLNRIHPEGQVSSFRFGAGSPGLSPSELFQESPPQERRPQSANSPSGIAPGTFRKQLQFASLTGTREHRSNGAPCASHIRRPSNPFNRPRRPYRRSLSMFENPGDVVKAKTEESAPQSNLQSVMDVEEEEDLLLPHFFPDGENDGIPRISRDTFLELLDGKYNASFTQKIIIDCRFEYEYDGGHIDGAINYNDKDLLARHLFETPMEGKTILIFHCEYSVHRAPRMARHIRAEDRSVNAECYPHLTYPEVYLLEGGYKEFFKLQRHRCYPQAYVEMGAVEHANTCERELGKLQQKRKCLGRANTFAFGGNHEPTMFDSPTAPGRAAAQLSPNMMIGNSPILGDYRSPARRMASY
ncbi:rhodanese-like domain-containing protein [Xylaria bambusicola]|uniref:rhodanese-like domain-containing protein n=1 Tax=Xylaria bambusicola TaxID=326684 RepID=UPI002008AB03|nr:rhodanese-like domain-containing protein [Xylaria bambusicola]KAI0502787.1 rhodanese-like domain-containing protein [Xylaria bambusicola]